MKTAFIDLHLHLDGSLDLPWAYEVAKKEGVISITDTFHDFYNIMYRTDYKTREEGFKKFEITCSLLQTRENLYECAYRLVKMLHEKEMLYAEIRFASQQHCLKGLSQLDALQAVADGVEAACNDFSDIICKVINCMMHKGNSAAYNHKENLETIEVTKQLLGKTVVGIDLAGYENNCDLNEYAYLYDKIHEYGIPCTLHAAEMGNGENIMKALAMHPNRIGHGVNSVQDPTWLQALVDSKTPIEVCVTSNLKQSRDYSIHPIHELIRAGVVVTINTDNMMFSKNDIAYEHYMLRQAQMTLEQIHQCTMNSIDAAFCSDEEKELLRQRVRSANQ